MGGEWAFFSVAQFIVSGTIRIISVQNKCACCSTPRQNPNPWNLLKLVGRREGYVGGGRVFCPLHSFLVRGPARSDPAREVVHIFPCLSKSEPWEPPLWPTCVFCFFVPRPQKKNMTETTLFDQLNKKERETSNKNNQKKRDQQTKKKAFFSRKEKRENRNLLLFF